MEASWRRLEDVLEPSWSRLGGAGADAVAAALAASDVACVGVPAAQKRSWTAPAPLLDRSQLFKSFVAWYESC